MSILRGQPLQLPQLPGHKGIERYLHSPVPGAWVAWGTKTSPNKVVTSAEKTLGKLRALPSLGQEINILHLNVGSAMPKSWSVTNSDKPDAPAWAYPADLDLVATAAARRKKSRLAKWRTWRGWRSSSLAGSSGSSHGDALFRAIKSDSVAEACALQHEYRNDGCSGRVNAGHCYGGNDDVRGGPRGGTGRS
jgi:hypothetical protein